MKSGVFQMSMEQYRSEHGLNQSLLKKIARSPAHLKYALEHPESSTPDQILGTVFDTAVFAADNLETCCYARPAKYNSGKEGMKPWHNGATVCKEWNKTHTDRPVVPQEDFSAVLLMSAAVFNHPAARMALTTPGGKGAALFCEDADTGLQLKCLPDWISGNVICDLKSCLDASPSGFARSIAQFGYDVQSAFYLDVAEVLSLGIEHFLFICCEKEPPYAVAVYELDPESIEDGRSKYRRYLRQYLECVVANKWPAYSQNVEFISLPQYARFAERNAQLLEDRPKVPALEVAP